MENAMNKFFDGEMILYIVVIVASIVVVVYAGRVTEKKCIEAGGQIIKYTTRLDTACIYPAKPAK